MKIVLHPPVTEELKQQVQRTAPNANVVMADKENVLTAIADADILFGVYNLEILEAAQNLKWIQTTSAGMDGRHAPPIANENIIVTNASGVHAIQVSEHALALTFALARGLHASLRHQLQHKW
ncbi:MAG: D-2-hydroxyacid dehydrogenase, partial [bacterium]|nr:D-2-hydroxyacid dehydrogenase [bacterium]